MFLKILLLVFLFHFRFFSNSFVQNIRIFKSWNDFHYAILFLFVIIKGVVPKPSIFFWIPFELLEQLLYFLVELNCFLPKEQLLSLMNLLDNDPKNPSDWVILQIWALESFKSNDILLLSAFLSFVFCLVVSNNSCGRSFPSSILELILRVVPVLFLTAVFSFFSCVSFNFTFMQILLLFLLIVQEWNKLLLLYLLLLILFY